MALSSTQKRTLINVVLILVVAGLAWMVYLQLQKDQQGAETLYDESIGESVTTIAIQLPNRAEIIIVAKDGDQGIWDIVKPLKLAASKQSLQQLFTFLGEPILAEYNAEGKDLKTFGLADNAIRLTFNSVEYRLGNLNPVNYRRYVLLKDRVLMVNEAVYELLMRGVDGFKEKS